MGLMHLDYLSQVLGYHTNIHCILPACTHKGKAPAATLYLLHGGSGNSMDWIRYTAIERYADAYEVAVVMPEVDGACFYTDMKYGYNYFTYLTEEVVAVAESLLPVNKESSKRLVAGFSMGGYGAFKWAFHKPDFFKAAASLSGASFIMDLFEADTPAAKAALEPCGPVSLNWGTLEELRGSMNDSKTWIDHAAETKVVLPMLFASMGTEDPSFDNCKAYLKYCEEKGINVHYEEMQGGHDWPVWEEMIQRFLKWAL